MWLFSNLVEKEGPRIPGDKDSSVCFLKILSALLTFFRFYAMSFFAVPNSSFSIKPKSPCREPLSRTAPNNVWVSSSQTEP